MSDLSRRITLFVDGVTHCAGRSSGDNAVGMACGLVVFVRSLDAIMKMHIESASRDVDCMTCLVAEARDFK